MTSDITCLDCGKPVTGKIRRGRCENCYRAHIRKIKQAGDFTPSSRPGEFGPTPVATGHPGAIALERIQRLPNGCWRYMGYINTDGYGVLDASRKPDGRHLRAHRMVWEFLVGPIGDGLELDHLCHGLDNECPGGALCMHRRCVNPEHLEAVPGVVNNARGQSPTSVNAQKTHCIRGHEFTPENTYWRPMRDGKPKPSRQCRRCKRLSREQRSSPH